MKRNYGIDILKITSMLLVLIHHIIISGELIDVISGFKHDIVAVIYLISYSAVDIFILCTGYLYGNRNRKVTNLINLWLEVFFYSIVILLLFLLLNYQLSSKQIISCFFPIINDSYWFVTQYFALFLFIPVLNKIINNKSFAERIIIVFVFLFSICSLHEDLFHIINGFSFLWFCILYLIGAYVKNYYNKKLNKNIYLLFYIISLFLFCLSIIIIKVLPYNITNYFSIYISTGQRYSSIFVLLCALFLFMYFKEINVTNEKLTKFITVLCPLSFAVYLIHCHPLIKTYFIYGGFRQYGNLSTFLIILFIIGASVCIFTICVIIDYLRTLLFDFLNMNKFSCFLYNKVDNILNKIIKAIIK